MKQRVSDFIKYQLKYNQILRAICKPFVDLKRKCLYKEYLRTEYPNKILKYKGICEGKRCFIIGNGPSLTTTDLLKLKDEYTFAANRIYNLFDKTDWRPTYYVSTDNNFLADNYDTICSYKMKPSFLEYTNIKNKAIPEGVIGIYRSPGLIINRWNDQSMFISEDLSKCFSEGYTVTFVMIQLAIYMGFKAIYLLGIDFNYSVIRDAHGKIHKDNNVKDYFDGKKYASTVQNYNSTLKAYQVAKEYCDNHGIIIKNATRGGKLKVFERIDFDSLFNN